MTATLDAVTRKKAGPEASAEQQLAQELVARAREQGVSLTGPDGLLKQLTKAVLETALNQEMTEHLGHDKHGPAGNEAGNVRNGTRAKTVLTEATGQVDIDVPRDRAGTFEPQIVKKRQRRLTHPVLHRLGGHEGRQRLRRSRRRLLRPACSAQPRVSGPAPPAGPRPARLPSDPDTARKWTAPTGN